MRNALATGGSVERCCILCFSYSELRLQLQTRSDPGLQLATPWRADDAPSEQRLRDENSIALAESAREILPLVIRSTDAAESRATGTAQESRESIASIAGSTSIIPGS